MPQDLPKAVRPSEAERAERSVMLKRLMSGLALWGLVLGVGAMMFGVGPDGGIAVHVRPIRGMIVWGCVGGFLAFWGLLLRNASNR